MQPPNDRRRETSLREGSAQHEAVCGDSEIRVQFYRGTIENRPEEAQNRILVYWSVTPDGIFAVAGPARELLPGFDPVHVRDPEMITDLDLTGVNREGLAVLVTNILARGYLERPGVKNKGEAVLFALVNEAMQILATNPKDD